MIKKLLLSIAKDQRRITVATVFTLARIVLAPIIALCIIDRHIYGALLLFIGAACTDLLDGFIARNYNQKTVVGAYLDPLADKFLVFLCFCALVIADVQSGYLYWQLLVIFIIKETIQLFGGLYLVNTGYGFIEPTWLGKTTTLLQAIFIGLLLIDYVADLSMVKPCGFIIVSGSMVITCMQYVFIGLKRIKMDKREQQ
jgi:cardiolipin synthase